MPSDPSGGLRLTVDGKPQHARNGERPAATLEELLDRIEENADEIYVRDEINGVWGNYRLSEMPAPRALHWAFEWIRRGKVAGINQQ